MAVPTAMMAGELSAECKVEHKRLSNLISEGETSGEDLCDGEIIRNQIYA